MQDKKEQIINEINKLLEENKIDSIEIASKLLKYLELKDLENLKAKVLNSLNTLSQEQKEWLKQFKKE